MRRIYLLGSIIAVSLFSFVLFNNFTFLTNSEEVNSLKNIVASENSAKALFSSIQKKANNYLAAKPDPIVRIYSEGFLASNPKKIRTALALLDMEKIEALTWASILSSDDIRYEAKAKEFILAWAKVNTSDGNAINETKFERLIRSYSLIKKSFTANEVTLVNNWLKNKANMLMSTYTADNWESHRLMIAGLTAAVINDAKMWGQVKHRFMIHLNSSFYPDGASYDFYRRDALKYHLYSIEPLLTLACVAQRNGEDFFTSQAHNGATLQKTVDFVVPYATGLKTHMEFQNTQSKADKRRAAAGEAGYIPHLFVPKSALRMFSLAGCFDSHYDNIAVDLSAKLNTKFVTWQSVLNAIDPHRKGYQNELSASAPAASSAVVPAATYIVNFNCGISGNNLGCQGLTSCKNNDEIVEVKAVCNLEENWGNVSTNLQAVLSTLNWGGLQVSRVSDRLSDGLCHVNSTQTQSGKVIIRKSANAKELRFGCKEQDNRSGGDCRILGQVLCRKKQ